MEEINYREPATGMKLLKEIVDNEPLYARAYFQLGKLYYYNLNDYQAAGYYFKTCMDLEPSFPDNYAHYLDLAGFLGMGKLVKSIAEKALEIPGVDVAEIYRLLGLFAEKSKDSYTALSHYQRAYAEVTCKDGSDDIKESIDRVKGKMNDADAYRYHLTG